jgi:23S rRNA U2552 (ribose-2'-O)-methylase RlmE/FtsJ
MRVQVCETVNVDIETFVEVNVNSVLCEYARQIEECELNSEPPSFRMWLAMLDFCTKMLAKVPDCAVSKVKPESRAEMVKRLQAELDKWSGRPPEVPL